MLLALIVWYFLVWWVHLNIVQKRKTNIGQKNIEYKAVYFAKILEHGVLFPWKCYTEATPQYHFTVNMKSLTNSSSQKMNYTSYQWLYN